MPKNASLYIWSPGNELEPHQTRTCLLSRMVIMFVILAVPEKGSSKNVVDRIETRLERLEQGVTAVQTGLQRLQTPQDRYSHSANGSLSSWFCAAVDQDTTVQLPGSSRHGLRCRFVRDVDSQEFYIGPMSLLGLIEDAKELVL
ncbi:hypothetical protein FB567DRAFT_416696, partial [Paraphoma chrysanthemicola]